MGKLFILCQNYYDETSKRVSVGGIEVYISNLCQIALKLGFEIVIIQYAKSNFEFYEKDIRVVGVNVSNIKRCRNKNKTLYKKCMKEFKKEKDLLLYATEEMAQRSDVYSIAIQHGIYWDVEREREAHRWKKLLVLTKKMLINRVLVNSVTKVNKLVCVDYNYMNWYKTQVLYCDVNYEVIPNFSGVPEYNTEKHMKADKIRVIFARRFQVYRGTRIFATAIKRILNRYENVEVIIAGEGPDKEFLLSTLGKYENVRFITYSSSESLEVHKDMDIAVVPTIGSEGTSLSLLEAMASQCAVICTNIGGMTNVVLDHFNGLMVQPKEECLYEAMVELIENSVLRKDLSDMAYETVKSTFSYDKWKESWIKVLKESGKVG